MAALRGDEDDAITTLGTIECRCILEDLHLLDILGIDVEVEVSVVAIMEGGTGFLHVANHTVDDHQRLCVGIE